MMKRLSDLSALIDATRRNLEKHNYHRYGIRQFEIVWERLTTFMGEKRNDSYEPICGLSFLHDEMDYPNILQQPLTAQQKYTIRAIRLLNDYQETGTISAKLTTKLTTWDCDTQTMRDDLIKYLREKQLSKSTIKTRLFSADRFLKIIVMERNIRPNELSAEIISEYIADLTEYSKQTVAVILAGLRFLFKFFHEKGYTDVDYSQYVPRLHGAYSERVPHILNADDVGKLLNSVDRGSPLGKRDYAILVIAAMLGLRDSDITDLTFDNLDWEKCRIELFQRKTGKLLCLPLIPLVGEAIIDYLKYGRPQTNCQYVFVKHCAPYEKKTSFYAIMQQRLKNSGIQLDVKSSRGLHILRHTLASELIRQGEAYTTVSAILGHVSSKSTDTYTHVDIDGLLKCALDLREVTVHD